MEATQSQTFEEACAKLHGEFFAKFPNNHLRDLVRQALDMLLGRQKEFRGNVGEWAGGLVYTVGSGGFGVPGVINAEMEEVFGKMAAIRRRAAQIKQTLGDDAPLYIRDITTSPEFTAGEFTLRDEANAICAYAFRNGPIEDIHADGRISDTEMKHLMIRACESMEKLLVMKQATPDSYDAFVRDYNRKYCWNWQR